MGKLDYSKVTDRQRLAIDDVMDTFEFHKVERHMIQTNWGWATPTPDNEYNLEVPDEYRIRAALRKMLVDCYTRMTICKESEDNVQYPCWSSCGGFTVYVWPDDSCQVFFSVTEMWVDEDMIDCED